MLQTLKLSAIALAAGAVFEFANANASIVFYLISSGIGLSFVFPKALRAKKININTLMSIAVIGAIVMAFFEYSIDTFRDAAIVIVLYQLGEYLEDWSMDKTKSSIKELMSLVLETAHVLIGNDFQTVSVSDIYLGAKIKVLPGEKIPLDGKIIEGRSSIDESPITGESIPVDKSAGDTVYGATLNTASPLTVEVTSTKDTGTIAKIVGMVQGAEARHSSYERFIDRFAAIYTPIVIIVSLVIGILVPLIFNLDWQVWLFRALTLLVISCPCALVISTPVTFVSAITRASRMGVLVKGGTYLDIASKVDTVAFDKTGTLTEGKPEVIDFELFNGCNRDEVLAAALALEKNTTHSLAKAIVEFAERNFIETPSVSNVVEIPAKGVSGKISGSDFYIGKSLSNDLIKGASGTSIFIYKDGILVGKFVLADKLRASAKSAIEKLKQAGIKKIAMLTGDVSASSASIAKMAGIEDVYAELLPDEKLRLIEKFQTNGSTVAMVGDGINDAPALASADLGITLGQGVSDTALEVADVAVLSNDLLALPSFFRLAKKAVRTVGANIAFALVVKIAVIVAAILGFAGMAWAIFADTGVTLIVALVGMRLLKVGIK